MSEDEIHALPPEEPFAGDEAGLCESPQDDTLTPPADTSKPPRGGTSCGHFEVLPERTVSRPQVFWDRLRGKDRDIPSWLTSFRNALTSSRLNVLLLCVPIAWISHFENLAGNWSHRLTFAFCFMSITALNKLIDWSGKEMALYLGRGVGDFLVTSATNAVDAILAIVLLCRCDLPLLQSLIIGVIVLHLILIPGVAFLAGGALVWEQQLHEHHTQLNRCLVAIGVLATFLPTTFFAALDRGAIRADIGTLGLGSDAIVSDNTRAGVLAMSRGLVILLLIVYVCCRIHLHDPLLEERSEDRLTMRRRKERYGLSSTDAGMNPWACVAMVAASIAITTTTAVFLVESIDGFREEGHIPEKPVQRFSYVSRPDNTF